MGAVGSLVLAAGYVSTAALATRGVPLSPAEIIGAPEVPALSARRAPTVLSVTMRTGRVARAVRGVASTVPTGSCLSVSWRGQELAGVNMASPLTPASTMKVVTASVALETLGKDHVFETVAHGTIGASGSVDHLYLVGGGDPVVVTSEYPATEKYATLSPTTLESLADALVSAGVRSVSAGVSVSDSRYDGERFVAAWPSSFHFTEAGPLGALMVNDGVVIGEPKKADDPAIASGTELARLLVKRGVGVAGGVTRAEPPSGLPVIASVKSAPLTSVLAEMLINSDNNTAELMLKEIGVAKRGRGTTVDGASVVLETLKNWRIDQGVTVMDGSGLAAGNKVSCGLIVALLSRGWPQLSSMMAVAGVNGTLRDSFEGSSVRGRLLGKTGTLSGVKALAGYVTVSGDEPIVFALIMNRPGIDNRSSYRPLWDSLGSAMGRAQGAPSAEELAP